MTVFPKITIIDAFGNYSNPDFLKQLFHYMEEPYNGNNWYKTYTQADSK